MRSAAARIAVRIVVCGVALVLVFLFVRRVPVAGVALALRRADAVPFALAVAVYLTANTVAKVRRWAAFLRAVPRCGPAVEGVDLARVLFASQATSNLLPARAGEAVRVLELRRRGYAVPGLLAAQLLEKVVEAATLCLVSGCAAGLGGMPPVLRVPLWSVALLGLLLLALVAFVRPWRERSGALASGVLWSCLADLSDASVLGLCLHAVGVPLGPASWLVVLLAVNLAILVPSTPGHLGVLEGAAAAALVALGVPAERALAGAVLYHAIQIGPSTALGLFCLGKQWMGRRSTA